MNSKSIAVICLKILAVYLFFQFIVMLPTTVSFIKMNSFSRGAGGVNDAASMVVSFLLVVFSYLATSTYLFLRADKVAAYLVKGTEEEVHVSGTVSDSFLTLAFQCLGVYALITWFPALIQTLCRTILQDSWATPVPLPFSQRFYQNWSVLISPVIGSIVGLLLVFKGSGLVRLVQLSRPMSKERSELETTIPGE